MALQFYNTMSRKKEIFKPIEPGKVGMYNCGPTVYNYPHVGNLRAFMFADLLKRYLKFKGYQVKQVMNLTDVDDKIIKKCAETKTSIKDYTETYKQAFFKDIKTLNIEGADEYPAATDHIPEMVDLVQTLLDKGMAYKAEDGNIFFKISAFPNYGKLQRLDMENMRSGGRVNDDEYDKESANDFALWKAYKPEDGEVYWDTKLGKGRPGWHIECSAMSRKCLGEQTIDIHTGGVDNLFPHHENEIAQSEGAYDHQFVKYWLHCEHLLWDNTKMSKSLGNIMYIDGLIEKGYSPREIRYTLLSTHYRKKLNFSLEILDSSRSTLKRVDDFIFEIKQSPEYGDRTQAIEKIVDKMLLNFENSMDDDLNISQAIGALFTSIKEINKIKAEKFITEGDCDYIKKGLKRIDEVLGVKFRIDEEASPALEDLKTEKHIKLLNERQRARENKDWVKADEIRKEFDAMGYMVIDHKDGSTEIRLKDE
ncbi:MAG: cysteine--tRNA ligase [Candidatus Marinimicrobia bacterium]|nr:cysteine--tRNA ligase [Candidatus Neomarinimicrobiota bacterium]